ncbi:MerR family transcriptional regulator [Streptomyces sp. DH37]|uniref:MerR family transcriptional regulator n=1 Tax=Streptomyces sp. DH37 TaxID=3040122 RepID=UPI0024418ED4|nr:MerR family transcriptional regulator [Streptomyces sp. DH37]MDG9705570.1 MerR family transcriptional regulator [Streptomyces sp. DH37]
MSDVDILLTGTEAAALATKWRRIVTGDPAARVTLSAISKWRQRGHLAPTDLDAAGRPLYHSLDLARAERRTRSRALRLLGISDTTHGSRA